MKATNKENQANRQMQQETAKAEFQQRLQGILGANKPKEEEYKKVVKKARMERLSMIEQGQEKTVITPTVLAARPNRVELNRSLMFQ